MRRLRVLLSRLGAFRDRDKWEADIDDELRSNFELHVEDNMQAGMSPTEARRAARLRYGAIASAKDAFRDRKTFPLVESIVRDSRYCVRSLSRNKSFSATVVATLALCIGANFAIFSALYDLVLRPLPFEDPERLYRVMNHEENGAARSNSSWSQYLDFKRNANLFEGFAFLYEVRKPMVRASGGELVEGQSVSADLFDLLGVAPLVGRFFSEEENLPGNHRVVVLPQSVWESDFDSRPDVLGEQIRFSGEAPYTIVGVAPRAVEVFDSRARFFVPFIASEERFEQQDRYLWPIDLWARLREGVGVEAGLAQLKALDRKWLDAVANQERRARNEGRIDQIALTRRAPLRAELLLLQSGGLLVLLVGCVNVLSLFLIRASRRRQELAVRVGLGAGKLALVRLMLVESFLLAGLATVCGAFLAWGGLTILNKYLRVLAPETQAINLSAPSQGYVIALSFGIAFMLGMIPIVTLWRRGSLQRIGHSVRGATAESSTVSLAGWLLIAQVAAAFVLLIGAGLLTRSLANVMGVAPGFNAERVVRARVSLRGIYGRQETASLRRRVVDALLELPGVENVAWSHFESLTVNHRRHPFYLRTRPQQAGQGDIMLRQVVSADYFATMDIPLLAGRLPTGPGQGWVVDEAFAKRYFPDSSAIGAKLYYQPQGPDNGGAWPQVLGVVGRAHFEGLARRDGPPVVYDVGGDGNYHAWDFTALLRTSRQSAGVITDLRSKLKEIDPELPLSRVGTLQEAVDALHFERRGATMLLGSFAGIALLLAAIGVYGGVSYDIARRKREIGIRIALGGSRPQILGLVLRQGLLRTGLGLFLGFVIAAFSARVLQSHLFDVSAHDPTTYAAASVVLLVAMASAGYVPARRALRVRPLESLRLE